jgi:alpha-1,2-mannosyltransferase
MVPDRLVPYFDPWTTPAVLWMVVVLAAALLGLRGRRLALLAAGAAVGIAIWKAWAIGPPTGLLDLMIYTNSARAWLDGSSLFSYRSPVFNLSATYPPIGLLPFSVFTPLSAELREILFTCVSVAAVGGAALCASVLAGIERGRRAEWTLWALAVAIVTMPVWLTLRQGQVNAILWLLVLGDVVLLARGSRFSGIGIGAATAIKLVPGLFIVWLLVVGWRRPAVRAIATAAALTALGWVLAPDDSRRYWTDLIWNSDHVGRLDDARNNSLLGMLSRIIEPGAVQTCLWVLALVIVTAVGLARARRATRSEDLLAAVIIIGCTSALVSPISWTHHLGYLVLAAAALLPLMNSRHRWMLLAVAALPVVDPGNLGDDVVTSLLRMALMLAVVLALPIVSGRSLGTTDTHSGPKGLQDPNSRPSPQAEQAQAARTPRSRSTNS